MYIVVTDILNAPRPNSNIAEQIGNATLLDCNQNITFTRSISLGQVMAWNDSSLDATQTPFGIVSLSGNFTKDQFKYTICYSEIRAEYCRIKFSIGLLWIIIICNASKTLCMLVIFWSAKEPPLVKLGDAITSFLDNPDPTTTGLCLILKTDVQGHIWKKAREPFMWRPTGERTFTVNGKCWVPVNLLYVTASQKSLTS